MTTPRLRLTRSQILAHRRRVNGLDQRMPWNERSLASAAWAGLQDSMPRAALLSLHARLNRVQPDALDHPSLVQVWGPRFSTYAITAADRAIFTVGRRPGSAKQQQLGRDLADRLEAATGGRRVKHEEAAKLVGVGHPNALRYAAPTGRVLIRWDGARQPEVWTVPPPDVDRDEARLELARRHLRVFGPSTPEGFASWAGIRPRKAAVAALTAIDDELLPVHTPIGDALILATDEGSFRGEAPHPAPARLLPSGDAFYLLQGAERELLVPDAARRDLLWTSRVWPGAVLVDGDIVGTWRRSKGDLTVEPWKRLTRAQREAVEDEAASLPLPGVDEVVVTWRA